MIITLINYKFQQIHLNINIFILKKKQFYTLVIIIAFTILQIVLIVCKFENLESETYLEHDYVLVCIYTYLVNISDNLDQIKVYIL